MSEVSGAKDEGRRGRDIRVSAVKKIFDSKSGKTLAVDSTSFQIKAEQFVSIVGPSGCGKSTLMRMIGGLTSLTEGEVRLDEHRVFEPSPEVGIAFQRPVLLPWLTVARNIAMPAELEGKWRRDEIERRVDMLLDMVRLPGSQQRYPRELSGGMQQRVAIARALMTEPSVILMDEPFGALDALTREHLHDELLAIWERNKATIIFITHDISEAVYLSDRVLVMAAHPGRVIADIAVDLPRPRGPATRGMSEFAAIGNSVRALIRH
jgi:NitT/TauT family transport system ATP-binding protein